MKFKTYLVGGAVRDEILGVKPKDLDFVVLAPSFAAMREALLADGAIIFVEKPEYVTIRCRHPKFGAADFACGRKESNYSDGRHPDSVVITENLVEDLARRDFTIGAIAKDIETKEIVDPFDGRGDIDLRVVRCVGEPNKRFTEDKLRLFRAVRFAVQKNFQIHPNTLAAMHYFIEDDFNGISTERIREELLKTFQANTRQAIHWIFNELPNLGIIMHKRGVWLEPTTKVVETPVINKKDFIEVMG